MKDFHTIIDARRQDARYNTSYPLSPRHWAQYRVDKPLAFVGETELSFYIHVPFCERMCKFCEYVKYRIADEVTQHRYLDIVERDMECFVASHPDITLTGFDIGGGTPTALCHSAFARLVGLLRTYTKRLATTDDFLPSIEATFTTIDEEKTRMIREAGFRRISFGLQNINYRFLETNHRDDGTFAHQVEVFNLCRKHDIEILNLDLMYGFAEQRTNDLLATLVIPKVLKPEHLTVYELRTNMLLDYCIKSSGVRNSQYKTLHHHITGQLGYDMPFSANTASLIGDDGVSSYLKHRMTGNGSYKGFGIAAQSKSRKGLSYNIGKARKTLAKCIEQDSFELGGDVYDLPPKEMLAKYVAICGYCGRFRLSKMQEILGEDPREVFKEELDFLIANKYLRIKGDTVQFTPKGFQCYGAILSLFYPN